MWLEEILVFSKARCLFNQCFIKQLYSGLRRGDLGHNHVSDEIILEVFRIIQRMTLLDAESTQIPTIPHITHKKFQINTKNQFLAYSPP